MLHTLASRCPFAPVDWFWFVVVGLPRLAIAWFGLMVTIVPGIGSAVGESSPVVIVVFGFVSALLLVPVACGLRSWWRRRRWVCVGIAGLIALDLTLYAVTN